MPVCYKIIHSLFIDFEEKLEMMGFNVESGENKVKATADLTPYRQRDQKVKEATAAANAAPAHKPPPSGSKSRTNVKIEDTKVTEVKFSDTTKHSVVQRATTQQASVTSSVVFTPSKPSTAYAQPNAAGKTPSIYSLIKKNTAGGASGRPPAFPSLGAGAAKSPAKNR